MRRVKNKRMMDFMRKRLIARRESMIRDMQRTIATSRVRSNATGPGDEGDYATASVARETALSLAQMAADEIGRINEALRLLDEGSYGLCGNCGRRISSRRLWIMPFATLCAQCQRQEERRPRYDEMRGELSSWARVEDIAGDALDREKYLDELEREVGEEWQRQNS